MTRIGILYLATLAMLLSGSTCLPLIDGTVRTPISGNTLAVAVEQPLADRSVVQGTIVELQYSAANLTGEPAFIDILVESRDTLRRTILAEDIGVTGTGETGSIDWDTTGFSGPFAIIARVRSGGQTKENTGPGRVTVDAPPTFTFTAPSSDVSFGPGDSIAIEWVAGDDNATIEIGLDSDATHDSGNEIILLRDRAAPSPSGDDSFNFTGNDADNNAVPEGSYRLFGRITDPLNDPLIVEAGGRVDVTTASTSSLGITAPSEDVSFLPDDPPVTIEYGVFQSADALIDLKVDRDDNHANGNEITILGQEFVDADTDTGTFPWDGFDADGVVAPDGIYSVLIVASTTGGTPVTVAGTAFIFLRTSADQPLISVLTPATAQTVNAGQFVSITWRDDDPTDGSVIRVTVDDDNLPDESTETGEAEVQILSGRLAQPDGVQDSFSWQVPSSLPPGTYHVFAYVDRNGLSPFDNVSEAPGVVIVRDPANP